MSKKKRFIAVTAVLLAAGTVAAISATGPRHGGGWHGFGGDRQGGWQRGSGDGHDGTGRRGMFQRELTKDQYDGRVRERFARLDKNSDGVIESAEIEGAMAQRRAGMLERFRGARGSEPGDGLIRRFDTNKDGKVTRDEGLAHVRKRFAEADLNNDGRLTDDDLPPNQRGQNAIQRMVTGERGGRGGGMARGLAWLGDVDVKDGAVALDAVLAAAGRQFDRFDRNKDGAIDKADFEAMRKDMTDYQVKRFIHANGADKEGKVSRDQFFAKANERFAEMDADGDGKIGRGDGGRRGMRGHGRHDMDGGSSRGPGFGEDRPMRGPDGPRGSGAPSGPTPKQ